MKDLLLGRSLSSWRGPWWYKDSELMPKDRMGGEGWIKLWKAGDNEIGVAISFQSSQVRLFLERRGIEEIAGWIKTSDREWKRERENAIEREWYRNNLGESSITET